MSAIDFGEEPFLYHPQNGVNEHVIRLKHTCIEVFMYIAWFHLKVQSVKIHLQFYSK